MSKKVSLRYKAFASIIPTCISDDLVLVIYQYLFSPVTPSNAPIDNGINNTPLEILNNTPGHTQEDSIDNLHLYIITDIKNQYSAFDSEPWLLGSPQGVSQNLIQKTLSLNNVVHNDDCPLVFILRESVYKLLSLQMGNQESYIYILLPSTQFSKTLSVETQAIIRKLQDEQFKSQYVIRSLSQDAKAKDKQKQSQVYSVDTIDRAIQLAHSLVNRASIHILGDPQITDAVTQNTLCTTIHHFKVSSTFSFPVSMTQYKSSQHKFKHVYSKRERNQSFPVIKHWTYTIAHQEVEPPKEHAVEMLSRVSDSVLWSNPRLIFGFHK